MQTTNFRHLLPISGYKALILFLLFFSLARTSQAQSPYYNNSSGWNLDDHDDKPFYFGIVLGYNTSHYLVSHHPVFLEHDTIFTVNSINSGRIHLGIMANWQISKRFDLRTYPLNLIFSEKQFVYTLNKPAAAGDDELEKLQRVESIVMSWPFQVRLKSDRIGNFRVYTLAGVKLDYDLASNASSRNSENIMKVKPLDYGVELGVGFQFFFKYFILAPEIKISNGLGNVHARDASLVYSNVVDKLHSRMILFSLHFEGGGLRL
jgi:Outer membrane protein beta-barrel domain